MQNKRKPAKTTKAAERDVRRKLTPAQDNAIWRRKNPHREVLDRTAGVAQTDEEAELIASERLRKRYGTGLQKELSYSQLGGRPSLKTEREIELDARQKAALSRRARKITEEEVRKHNREVRAARRAVEAKKAKPQKRGPWTPDFAEVVAYLCSPIVGAKPKQCEETFIYS
jgi:hypothetical protein